MYLLIYECEPVLLDQEKPPVPAPLPTQRAQSHVVNGSVSSVSWIDPKSPIGELFPETRRPATIRDFHY
jgi:hypothetical protein